MPAKKSLQIGLGLDAAGRAREDALFPGGSPDDRNANGLLGTCWPRSQRIQNERLRGDPANAAMVVMYWDIGRMILKRQAAEGWGAKVIDRLSLDLRTTYPEMEGLSSRNLLSMRAFAATISDSGNSETACFHLLPWGMSFGCFRR